MPAPKPRIRVQAASLPHVNGRALLSASGRGRAPCLPLQVPQPAPGVLPADRPALAMDDYGGLSEYAFAQSSYGVLFPYADRPQFLGFPALAELAQVPEYRRMVGTLAEEMTRKWFRLTSSGDSADRVKLLTDDMEAFRLKDVFREAWEHDGFFGRGQIYIDTGDSDNRPELATPLALSPRKIKKGSLVGFRTIEPIWSYPAAYNSTNPLKSDWYKPQTWYVMGLEIHRTRLITLISREVPDMLKPAYMFAGISLTQLAKRYVENWTRTQQSVADLLEAFTVWKLKTNLQGAEQQSDTFLSERFEAFQKGLRNRSLAVVDFATEDVENISAPLSGLHELQAQSQEHMASVDGFPLIKLLGITPSGLNASSEGELHVWYDRVRAQQSKFDQQVKHVLGVLQLNRFGDIDPDIGFEWEPLWEPSAAERATIRKTEADTAKVYIDAGVIAPDEERERLAAEDGSAYTELDLNREIAPEPEDDGAPELPGQEPPGFAGAHDKAPPQGQSWITTETGSHILINGEGVVVGGAGGSLTGRHISSFGGAKKNGDGPSLGLGFGKSDAPAPRQSVPTATATQEGLGLAEPSRPSKPAHHAEAEVRAILGGGASEAQVARLMALFGNHLAPAPAATKPQKAWTPNGTEIEARPEVVDLGDLTTSNDDDGKVNPAFPQHLQPRDRSTAASQTQIRSLAGKLNPELLAPSPLTSSGAPIVGPDGVVESGNGRTMALRKVLTDPEMGAQRERYTSWLKSQGHNIEGMKNPVLVMRRTSDMTDAQRRQFVVEANERTTLGMGAAEQARSDAERAGANIDKWQGSDAGAASNAAFARGFMSSMSPEERGNMLDKDGSLSAEGERRIQSAVTAHAYGERFGPILDKFLGGTNDGMKAIANGMADASGPWAQLRKSAAGGTIPAGLDITRDLAAAVETVARARQLGRPVRELLDQTDLDRAPLSPVAHTLLSSFYANESMKRPAGKDAVAGVLSRYAELASKVSPEPDMFGTPPATAAQVLKDAMRNPATAHDAEPDACPDAAEDAAYYAAHGMAGDDNAQFNEADHPRAPDGKFGNGAGSAPTKAAPAKSSLTAVAVGANGERTAPGGGPLPAHVVALKLPPAWTDVHYSADPKSPLQAIGRDSKGREQRVYTKEFAASQSAAKFARIKELDREFSGVEAQNHAARQSDNPRTKAAADCAALVMSMGVRPGSEDDTQAKVRAYGATTLEGRHVVTGDDGAVSLQFTGKKGVALNLPVTDPDIARMLTERKAAAGDGGQLFGVNEKQLLDHVHSLDGGGFKTKDFRTLLGTRTAMQEVAKTQAPKTEKDYVKAVKAVATIVSKKLGNTPTVALQSYISPAVFGDWEAGYDRSAS